MKSIFAPVGAALLLASNALAQLTVNTPYAPTIFPTADMPTYRSTSADQQFSANPCRLPGLEELLPTFCILPGNQPSAPALIAFAQQTTTSLRWVVNITAGTSLGLDLRDNTGALAQSAPFTVQTSSDSSCLNAPGSTTTTTTTGTTTTGTTTTAVNTPTPPATTPPATTPTAPITTAPGTSIPVTSSTPSTSSTGTTSAATTTTTKASSATGNMANAGLAGALGIGAALMALVF